MVFHRNALMCMKKIKLINHDCLHILMLLYIMLYVMLFAYLCNAVFVVAFIAIDFCKCFLFHALSWFINT